MKNVSREKVWVVRQGDGRTVAEIVARAGEGSAAIAEGRVFIGKKRISRAETPVKPGEAVRIGPARAAHAEIEILFEEEGLVACIKPAGLPTVPDHASASHSLVAIVAKTLGRNTGDLRITSRLDREVSGVVIFALDAGAEARLKQARAEGRYQRRYVAIAAPTAGTMAEAGIWDAPIGRATDPRQRRVRGPEAKEAMTRWTRVAALPAGLVMLAVDPVTGRTHQIRVHASDAGAPLVGDRDYGGPSRLVLPNGGILSPARIALHAARVVVPGARDLVEVRAPIPAELEALWRTAGGDAEDWARAVTAETPRSG